MARIPDNKRWRRMQVHIRHGDKWREARETPTLTYFERAQQLQVSSSWRRC